MLFVALALRFSAVVASHPGFKVTLRAVILLLFGRALEGVRSVRQSKPGRGFVLGRTALRNHLGMRISSISMLASNDLQSCACCIWLDGGSGSSWLDAEVVTKPSECEINRSAIGRQDVEMMTLFCTVSVS